MFLEALPPIIFSTIVFFFAALGYLKIVGATIGFIVLVCACWSSPAWVVGVLLVALPTAPKVPLPFGNLYISTVMVIALVTVRIIRALVSYAPIRFRRTFLAAPILLFTATLLLSTTMNFGVLLRNPAQLLRLAQFFFYMSLFFVVREMVLSRKARRLVLWIVIASGIFEGIVGCAQWFAHVGLFATGTMDHEHNHLAAYLVFTGLLLTGVALELRSRSARMALFAGLAAMGVALVFSFSRSGYIAMGVGLLSFVFLPIRKAKKTFILILILVAAGVAYLYVPESVAYRFGTIGKVAIGQAREDISFSSRLGQWSEAYRAFKKNPLFGAGAMTFQMRDNYFVKTLGEAGLLATTALVWLIAVVLRGLWQECMKPEADPFFRGIRLGILPAAFALLVVFNLAGDFFAVHRLMGVFWIVLALLIPDRIEGEGSVRVRS